MDFDNLWDSLHLVSHENKSDDDTRGDSINVHRQLRNIRSQVRHQTSHKACGLRFTEKPTDKHAFIVSNWTSDSLRFHVVIVYGSLRHMRRLWWHEACNETHDYSALSNHSI